MPCSDGSLRAQGLYVTSQTQFEKSSVNLCQRHWPGGGAGNIGQLQRKQEGNRSGQCWQIPTVSEIHLKPAKC